MAELPNQLTGASTVAFAGICALTLLAPFERLEPVLRLPWQQVSNLELLIGVALIAWAVAALRDRRRLIVATPMTWPIAGLLATLAIAAVLAPSHAANAMKAVARVSAAAAVCLLTLNGLGSARRITIIVILAATAGVVVGICAIGESQRWPAMLTMLDQFREGVRVVGGQARASGPLQYPTITSMYLEIAFALTLGLLVWSADLGRPGITGLVLAATAVIAAGVALTFTRAGLITMIASLGIVGGWRWSRRGLDRGVALVAAAAVVMGLVVTTCWSDEAMHLRFTSENRQNWYRAAFSHEPTLDFQAGEIRQVDVRITNAGRMSWRGEPDAQFRASYHWIEADSTRVIDYDGIRTPFPRPLEPGDSVMLTMSVQAPVKQGQYRLVWDVVQEHRLWFSTEPGARLAMATATVTGFTTKPPPRHPHNEPIILPEPVNTVGRGTLWRAALSIIAAHPLLGIGLDNYRLSYGPYAGIADADPRVHSNNLYLEVLAGGGLLSGAWLAWLLWRIVSTAAGTWRELPRSAEAIFSGVSAAGVATLLHGLVDSFLTFTPTYLVMAMTLGLAMSPAWGYLRAHRL